MSYDQACVGLRLHDTKPGTLAERVFYAKQQGFQCCHLALSKTLGKDMIQAMPLTPGLACQVKLDLDGFPVTVLGCYLNLAHPDEEVYRQTVRQYVAHLRLNQWLGAGMVGTETGNPNADYAYDPDRSHTEESLELFIRRLEPVVRAAEKLGTMIAIEPVVRHIVSTPRRARRVLDAIASPNLGIIFDPVNLIDSWNYEQLDELIQEAVELLGEEIMTIHLKDFRIDAMGKVISTAAGTGQMDYTRLLRFVRDKKPCIQMTLEDSKPENAEAARRHIEALYGFLA